MTKSTTPVPITPRCVRHFSLLTSKPQPDQLPIEAALFLRLIYKNRNQHGNTKYFQMAMRTKKVLRRISESCVMVVARKALDSVGVKNPKNYKPSGNDKVPDAVIIAELLVEVRNLHLLMRHLVCSTRAGYSSFKVVAMQTYFIPTMLTFMAIFARLHQLALSVMDDLALSYEALRDILVNEMEATVVTVEGGRMVDVVGMEERLSNDLTDLYGESERGGVEDLLADYAETTGRTDLLSFTDSQQEIETEADLALDSGTTEALAPELDMFFASSTVTTEPSPGSNATKKKKKRKAGDNPSPVDDAVKQTELLATSSKKPKTELMADTQQSQKPSSISSKSLSSSSNSAAAKAKLLLAKQKKPKSTKSKMSADEIDAIFGL
ncbi:hypothetical protein HDU79_005727 [Rhizoclosmatium sp. JEL0117]|nr:hypothetical protein HDU79_005727 [Rhizoclosmatium sp. JEL0117]